MRVPREAASGDPGTAADLMAGRLHTPDSLFGIRRHEGRAGRVVARVGTPWLGMGNEPRPGALAVPLDVNLGLEVVRGSDIAGPSIVTTELSIDFTDGTVGLGDTVVVEGEAVSVSSSGAVALARAMHESGELLAVATATFRMVPGVGEPLAMERDPDLLPAPSTTLRELLGVTAARHDHGVDLTAMCDESASNARRALQGGVAGALAELAASELLGPDWRCRSLRAWFLRPVPIGTEMHIDARPHRVGGGFSVIDVTIRADKVPASTFRLAYYRSREHP
ncbi:MAG: Thioesterase-like superfamily [Naasia sp.]|jgi:acyl-coenzyme A thioesterase PaaI-like protein|nr:Thioesterase-like superfamily [Naasia sp.]